DRDRGDPEDAALRGGGYRARIDDVGGGVAAQIDARNHQVRWRLEERSYTKLHAVRRRPVDRVTGQVATHAELLDAQRGEGGDRVPDRGALGVGGHDRGLAQLPHLRIERVQARRVDAVVVGEQDARPVAVGLAATGADAGRGYAHPGSPQDRRACGVVSRTPGGRLCRTALPGTDVRG